MDPTSFVNKHIC